MKAAESGVGAQVDELDGGFAYVECAEVGIVGEVEPGDARREDAEQLFELGVVADVERAQLIVADLQHLERGIAADVERAERCFDGHELFEFRIVA